MNTFESIGLSNEILKAVQKLGFESPMPVQEQVIPAVLNFESDIIALSQTGTGKTAAYGLPILQKLDLSSKFPQCIILCPTRELCMQITKDLVNYGRYLKGFSTVAVYGGASIEHQINDIKRGVQVLVATPGRMNDIIRRGKVSFKSISTVVLDEADEMLNMGFKEELTSILENIPNTYRTLLFSATMPTDVARIASNYMKESIEITIGNKNSGAENVSHKYYVVQATNRYSALKRIVDFYPNIYGIVFCRTREETKDVANKLMKDGYNADALHGDLSQAQRDNAMLRFRNKTLQLLVATDVAARGLDVEVISHVINYNLPDELDVYTHRSGRTGRAGNNGISISIITVRDKHKIPLLEKRINKSFIYTQVPSGHEVCEKQLFKMITNMEQVNVNDAQIETFLPSILNKLEWMSKEEIIKRFVSIEFNRFLDYYKNADNLNINLSDKKSKIKNEVKDKRSSKNENNSNWVSLKINLGKTDSMETRHIIGLVRDMSKIKKLMLGRITIEEKYTIFEVDQQFVDNVISAFRHCRIEDREIYIKKVENLRASKRKFFNRDKR